MLKQIIYIVFGIIISLLAGAIGSAATYPEIRTWYAGLNKPVFNPPNWLFGPAWTFLYICMGIAIGIIINHKSKLKEKRQGILFFGIQLILNTLWSIVFFGLHSPLGALVIIALLWIFIFLTMRRFFKVSRIAGYFLVPYIAWVSFAAILNFSVFILNG